MFLLNSFVAARHMEISMFLLANFVARNMEISMFLATIPFNKLRRRNMEIFKLLLTSFVAARNMEIRMFLATKLVEKNVKTFN